MNRQPELPSKTAKPRGHDHAELVLANMGLAYKLAGRSAAASGSDIDVDDLRQEAAIALMRAAAGFDPSRGFRFSTYAWRVISRQLAATVRKHAHRKARLPTIGGDVLLTMEADHTSAGAPSRSLPDLAILKGEDRVLIERFYGLDGLPRASLAEIARLLKVSPSQARRIQDRALTRLRLDCFGLTAWPATEAA